jgi:outer membrane receptor protein involved in Fe transport
VRLSAPIGERIDWLVGVFYTDEDTQAVQDILAADSTSGERVGSIFHAEFPTTFSEYAVFTNLSFRLDDRFDVQIGGREGKNRQTYSELDSGPLVECCFGLPSPVINPEVVTRDSSFTYLVTPRWKIAPNYMLYARFASGYRAGGPNATCIVFGIPCHFEPDKTTNYELGLKADVLDRALTLDASLYYIDWKDIQLNLQDPDNFLIYFVNASRARSQGMELSVESSPVTGLTLSGWIAWSDAELTEDLPPALNVFGSSGDRLPLSSRLSGNVALDWQFPITGRLTGSLGGSVSYVGKRAGGFKVDSTSRTPELPSYTKVDLQAGLELESWRLNLFVNNVADKRGILSGDLLSDTAFIYITPRTIGLSLAKTF